MRICVKRHSKLKGFPGHLRDLSSSLAAVAARSSPVGSKLLHLSLGLSPPPLDPPAGGGGGGGCTGSPGGGSGCPLFRPNSHDIIQSTDKAQFNRYCGELEEVAATPARLSLHFLHTRVTPQSSAQVHQKMKLSLNNNDYDWLVRSTSSRHWLHKELSSLEVIQVVPPNVDTVATEEHNLCNPHGRTCFSIGCIRLFNIF